jgi:hypothetical protein
MTRLYQIVAVIFVAFGAFVLYLSLDLSYSADYGPGPGFFSFWLGILLILLGGIDFIGTTRRPREPFPKGLSRTARACGASFSSARRWWRSFF